MKKRLILILTLGLSLTGCLGKKAAPEEKETPPPPKIEESVESVESVEEKPEEKEEVVKSDPYQDVYNDIEGKKFYLDPGTSMVEAIYFYEDGYFDGMNKSGNDNQRAVSLYNGKFDIVEKIDNSTYKLKLVRLDYDVDPGKLESISYGGLVCDVHYGETYIFGDMVNDYLYLYYPDKNPAELDEVILGAMEQSGYKPTGNTLGKFVIGLDGGTGLMELKEGEY